MSSNAGRSLLSIRSVLTDNRLQWVFDLLHIFVIAKTTIPQIPLNVGVMLKGNNE